MDEAETAARALVAANIRRHRLAADLTQAALAESVGIETRFLQSLEAATDAPGFKTLVALSVALHIEVRDLFEQAEVVVRNPGRPLKRRG